MIRLPGETDPHKTYQRVSIVDPPRSARNERLIEGLGDWRESWGLMSHDEEKMARYMLRAEECRRKAEAAATEALKEWWLTMATDWAGMATSIRHQMEKKP